jgi:hypothetical protein
MSVQVTSITFKNPLDSTPVNWLLANVGDEVLITHNISVKEQVIASSVNPVILNNRDGYLTVGVCTGLDFSKFVIGDTIHIHNYVSGISYGNYTIVDKPDSTTIVLNTDIPGLSPATDNVGPDTVFSVTTPITALSYKYNFIENDEATNYYSKVDGTIQMATITGLNPAGGGTNKPMSWVGVLPYQIGSVVVDEISLTTSPVYSSNFAIKHTTRITPTMLAEQWDDLYAGIKPDYFFNLNCLKSVFFYQAYYYLADPNHVHILESDTTLGNTGHFNENWNTSLTNYYVENLVYTDVATVTTVANATLKPTFTDFEFYVRNTIDLPFSNGNTKLVLNFAKAPYDETEYQSNGRDLKHNFVWDSKLLTCASVPVAVNGDNYADLTMRSLSNLKATYVSQTSIKVTGRLAFDTLGIAVFEESEEPRYMFWVSVQNHSLTGVLSDRVNVKVDFSKFFYQTEFPSLLTFNVVKLVPSTINVLNSSYVAIKDTFSEDELVGYSEIRVNTDPLVTSCELTKFTGRIISKNLTSGEKFTLESKTINLPATPIVGGFQNFNVVQARDFHVPTTEIRKYIFATSTSTPGLNKYAFPFLVRWEYWQSLLSVNSFFFNSANPLNGFNHDWTTLNNVGYGGDWTLRYECEISAKVNGLNASYVSGVDFTNFDRNLSLADDLKCEIDTFDASTLVQLVDGGGLKYILGYANTRIKATFTRNALWPKPSIIIGIEVFELGGGVNKKRRMHSDWPSDADTWFIPLSSVGANRVNVIGSGTTVAVGECDLDYTQIASLVGASKWKITARIHDIVGATVPIVDGFGYLGSQDVYMIATNPVIEETIVTPHIGNATDCCSDFVWRVLADTGSSLDLKNDKTSFLNWYNKDVIATAVIKLVKPDLTEVTLTGSTLYGTPYDYGFKVNTKGEKLVGYLVDWKKVLTLFGEGIYTFKYYTTTIFGGSGSTTEKSYCLKQYTDARANGTTRIEYNLKGLIGDNKLDENMRDYADLDWYQQHRFDGVFYYNNSSYNTDEIQYKNGQIETVEDGQIPEYILDLKGIPAFKHDILRTDIYQANSILITDYNSRNFDNYFKKNVRKNGSYDPKWYPLKSDIAPVILKFKQGINNLRKLRS